MTTTAPPPTITPAQRAALRVIGRLGGLTRSEALTEARRANGAKGGRPSRLTIARAEQALLAITAAKTKSARTRAYNFWLSIAPKAMVRAKWTPALGPKPAWMDA